MRDQTTFPLEPFGTFDAVESAKSRQILNCFGFCMSLQVTRGLQVCVHLVETAVVSSCPLSCKVLPRHPLGLDASNRPHGVRSEQHAVNGSLWSNPRQNVFNTCYCRLPIPVSVRVTRRQMREGTATVRIFPQAQKFFYFRVVVLYRYRPLAGRPARRSLLSIVAYRERMEYRVFVRRFPGRNLYKHENVLRNQSIMIG